MNCINCGKLLENTHSKKYCSEHCQFLMAKKRYKLKHGDKIKAYNREYRLKNKARIIEYKNKWRRYKVGNKATAIGIKDKCNFCESSMLLEFHHIVYKPEVVIRLCRHCHNTLHIILKLYTDLVNAQN